MLKYCSQPVAQLTLLGCSKGKMFENYGDSFDFALPQGWLDRFAEWCEEHRPEVTYHLILSSTVWSYANGSCFGQPVTCCDEVKEAFDAFSEVIE